MLLHHGVEEGSEKEQYHLLGSPPAFSHFPHFPQVDCALSGADSQMGGLVYILGSSGPFQWTLMSLGVSPSTTVPTGFYSQGF